MLPCHLPACRYHKAVSRMECGLNPNKLVPQLRATVDEYRLLLPLVAAMCNTALKERHWSKMFAAIGTVLPRDETFTLQVGGERLRLDIRSDLHKPVLPEVFKRLIGCWPHAATACRSSLNRLTCLLSCMTKSQPQLCPTRLGKDIQ